MIIQVTMSREMNVKVETTVQIEVPDDYLGDHETYDDWFEEQFDQENLTLMGQDVEDQIYDHLDEYGRDDTGTGADKWGMTYVREKSV